MAAVAAVAVAGACDASPVAASVNGVAIKQTALNQLLRLETANTAYVSSINRAAAANGGGISVTGDAPNTLSTRFSSGILSTVIQAEAVHQRLQSGPGLPGPAERAATRAVDQALFGSLWLSFPPAFRDIQVTQDAEHAALEPATAAPATLRSAYTSAQRFFFAQVCTRTIAVSVLAPDGSLDRAASLGQARNLAAQYNLTHTTPALKPALGTPSGGVVACYDGAGLEAQGAAGFNQVLALAPGQAAAPEATGFGYRVLAVDSRQVLPFDLAAQKALALGIAQVRGSADPALAAVVSAARVTVDPQYGTWDPRNGAVIPASPLGANSSSTP